jgi:chemotaxis protein histidine kinase CheA
MQGLLAEVQDYAGTTMLGNGRVLLVLNLGAVLQ